METKVNNTTESQHDAKLPVERMACCSNCTHYLKRGKRSGFCKIHIVSLTDVKTGHTVDRMLSVLKYYLCSLYKPIA